MSNRSFATWTWIVTSVFMALWVVSLFVVATRDQQHEAIHQVTYWFHHVVAIPAIAAISGIILRDLIRSGRSLRGLWIGTVVFAIAALAIVAYQHDSRPRLSAYMVATANGDAAAAAQNSVRNIWLELRAKHPDFVVPPQDAERYREAVARLDALTARPRNGSNGMDWVCDVFTFAAAFVMLTCCVGIPLAASTTFHADRLYTNRVAALITLGISWIPLRMYADFHEGRVRTMGEDMFDPFSALGAIVMVALALLVAYRFGAIRVGISQREYIALAASIVGSFVSIIPSLFRNQPFFWFEQLLPLRDRPRLPHSHA